MENIKPMEGIAEDAYEESDVSSSFSDEEETPEFVPSAWDKFAIPSKSALRSPEKTLTKPPEVINANLLIFSILDNLK